MAEGTQLSLSYDLVFADTCVGGSTVAGHLGRARRGLRAFYLADYAVNPLGVKSPQAVREALSGWVRAAQGRASRLVVACNTASIRLRDAPEVLDLAAELGIRVHSMADFLERFLDRPQEGVAGRRVCLMGTEFTVAQPLYRNRLTRAGVAAVHPLPATRTEAAIAHFRHRSPQGRADILEEAADTISALSPADIRGNFDRIFSGWELEDVVSLPQGSIGP